MTTQNLLESVKHTIQIDTPKCIIQNTFDFDIMRDDLREWIFKEDDEGNRYRERIWAKIEEFGVEKWFKAKGYPTNLDAVWKNRYCGSLTTAEDEMKGCCATNENCSIEEKGYILWENYLPEALWNDKELSLSYRVGTKEYFDRIKEEEAHEKQNTLFDKENSSLAEESEDLDDRDESEFQDELEEQDEEDDDEVVKAIKKESICPVVVLKDYSKMTTLEKMEEHNKRLLTKKEESVNKEKDTLQEQQVSEDVERSRLSVWLNGNVFTEQTLQTSSSLDKPRNQLGSWSGGGGELKGTNEEIMDFLLDFYRNNLKKPYSDTETPFTTTLKIENCKIDIDKQAIDFLTKRGFDFKKLDTEERLLKSSQKIATQEDLMKAKTFELMEKAMTNLRDICWAIKGYFEFFLNRRNSSKEYHLSRIKKLGIDTSDLNKLKEFYDEKANIYHIYYCKVNEARWGKPCDEEYSYP